MCAIFCQIRIIHFKAQCCDITGGARCVLCPSILTYKKGVVALFCLNVPLLKSLPKDQRLRVKCIYINSLFSFLF